MSAHARATCAAIPTGVLLWLGLSPRVAHFIYTAILMPRCKSESAPAQTQDMLVLPVSFKSAGVFTLRGHLCTRANSQKLVVYYGGRRSNHAKNMIRAEALQKTGSSVFVFDYRGFGEAKGRANLSTLLEDGLAAYDAVISLGYSADQIVLYGESLGAAVAAYVSSKRSSSGLILQSGFSSLEVQIKDMIPPLRVYPRCMFPKLRLSTSDSIRHGHPPLLILHGDQDSVVDKKHAEQLFLDGGPNTKLVVLPGAEHVDVQARKDWHSAVSEFISSLDSSISSQNQGQIEKSNAITES
jgi:uncharacterized protein